jgi:hypothetical protein
MQEQARRKSGSAWTQLLIGVLVTPFSAVALFWGSSYGIAALSEGWHPVWFGDSSSAQVLVLNPDRSPDGFSVESTPVSLLAGYRAQNPGCTFLIPLDRKDEVQKRLETDLKLPTSTLEIKRLSAGEEEITLSFMDRADDSHGSRYKASKDGVQLESYRYAGDRDGIGIVLFAMFITFVIHVVGLGVLLGRAIFWWRRSRRVGAVTMQA